MANSSKKPVGHTKTYYNRTKSFDDKVLDAAGKKSSQYKSNTYERLKKDNRLELFKKLLSTAASKGYTREEACRYINQYMGDYFQGSGLCSNTLKMMLQRYPDINEAWSVYRDNIAGAATARIAQLISKSNDIELLLKVAKAFDNSGIVHDSDRSEYVPTKKTIIVQDVETLGTNITSNSDDSEETQLTIEQLRSNWETMENSDINQNDTDDDNVEAGDIDE